MTYQRPQAAIHARRLAGPRRFIHAVAGPRQVGKTALVQQVVEAVKLPVQFASADEPTLKPQRQLLVGGDGIPMEEFLTRDVAHWVGP